MCTCLLYTWMHYNVQCLFCHLPHTEFLIVWCWMAVLLFTFFPLTYLDTQAVHVYAFSPLYQNAWLCATRMILPPTCVGYCKAKQAWSFFFLDPDISWHWSCMHHNTSYPTIEYCFCFHWIHSNSFFRQQNPCNIAVYPVKLCGYRTSKGYVPGTPPGLG